MRVRVRVRFRNNDNDAMREWNAGSVVDEVGSSLLFNGD
jgi:hypothetical protein